MKFYFEFACNQLNSTNHSLLLEVSSPASCQHILTMCICWGDEIALSEETNVSPCAVG